MKKLLYLLLPLTLFAQSFIISKIPLPKTYIQNLDPYECDDSCLQEYLDNGYIFSFLAHADKKLSNKELDEIRMMNVAILNLGSNTVARKVKIAMLLPYKKIGKYASSTTNAVFAYLITKTHPFELKSYKIATEDIEDLNATLAQIQKDGFSNVIAPLTHTGAQNVVTLQPTLNIYFPTIHKNDINTTSPYFTFGAIDYKAQSELLTKEAISPLIIFSGKSNTGKKLAMYQEEAFKALDINETNSSTDNMQEEKHIYKYFISRRTTNMEHYLKENEKITEGSFILNTPIVKSGMIMSQLTLYDVNATNVLSTQINYDPLLLSMTQYADRKNMVVANSITEHNNILIEANALLANDIMYDWINYTTTVGIDYFFSLLTNEDREYNIELQENQMHYMIELLQPSFSKFIPYIHIDRVQEEDEKTQEVLLSKKISSNS